jgi:hypothetical protein
MMVPNSIRYTFALLTLLVLAAGLKGQDATHTKFGNFLLKVPNGWNPVQKEDAMLLVAPAPRPGTATYIVLAAGDLDGNLQVSFNELLTGIQKAYQILQGGQAMPLHSRRLHHDSVNHRQKQKTMERLPCRHSIRETIRGGHVLE